MSDNKSLTSPAIETFEDELDSHIAESLKDPEYLAANVDVERRLGLIRNLVALRRKLGLTQAQVARRMGVGQPTVSGFENEASDPRLSTVQRYARAVEAECVIVVQPAMRCDWIAPTHVYQEAVESAQRVRVDSSAPSDAALAWAANSNRNDFAMAA